MKRIIVLILFVFAFGAIAFPQSRPEPKLIEPQGESGLYEGHRNYGRSIAVFGGSLSVRKESDAAKQIWANELHAVVTSYGVSGAGFALEQGYSIQRQVLDAGVHDIYVLWASTNDYTHDRAIGSPQDYSVYDAYDQSKLNTQCGGINFCIKTLQEKNPNAEIYFFTSLRFFSSSAGHNPFSTETNGAGFRFADYVQAQKECCLRLGIPLFDQFECFGVNQYNFTNFYKKDALHLKTEGYLRLGPLQALFLADGN